MARNSIGLATQLESDTYAIVAELDVCFIKQIKRGNIMRLALNPRCGDHGPHLRGPWTLYTWKLYSMCW